MPTGDTVVTMRHETPVQWLMQWAATDPDRTALVTRETRLSYKQLAEEVQHRATGLAHSLPADRLVPLRVSLDRATVVELLAIQAAGAVPIPHVNEPPQVDGIPGPLDVMAVPTSGSTGSPKIVRLTGANIEASVVASRSRLGTSETDCWLLCLPLNHVGGLSVLWRSLEAGGSVAMAPFDLELPQFMSTVAPSVASMVPTMVHRLLESNPSVLAALRFVLVGGAAMSDELVDRASDLGVKIIRSYGMTETTSQMATIFSSQGGGAEVLDGVAIEITDPRGLPLPLGSTGLIAVDGRSVSPGYLGDAERTGPLNTTDIGFLHPDRSLVVLGRADDIVVTGGENVSLTKVGCVIAAIDGVSDAVAIGLPR